KGTHTVRERERLRERERERERKREDRKRKMRGRERERARERESERAREGARERAREKGREVKDLVRKEEKGLCAVNMYMSTCQACASAATFPSSEREQGGVGFVVGVCALMCVCVRV